MRIVMARNVNSAYQKLMDLVRVEGNLQDTRNGPAMVLPFPLLLGVRVPQERVLFDAPRNANPFFHLMEALWMLAGRRDVEFIQQFNSNIAGFSDDGDTFNAAYGYRWRNHFGYDQIETTCDVLSNNPNDRRCVIAMWDGSKDLRYKGNDAPCNTTIMCRVDQGMLDFTITNRSNDLVWGLCGANAVHMSILQEYMARRIGVPMGSWYHLTNNLHVYQRHFTLMKEIQQYPDFDKMAYPTPEVLLYNYKHFDEDCNAMCEGKDTRFDEPFFQGTVEPMLHAWRSYKEGDFEHAMRLAGVIRGRDWKRACVEWLQRAQDRRVKNAH